MIQSALLRNPRQRQRNIEAPARGIGKAIGTYLWDLVCKKDAILLCELCKNKFDHKASHYYKDRRFVEFVGKCDSCREMSQRAALFIHENYLTDSKGQGWADRTWIPK